MKISKCKMFPVFFLLGLARAMAAESLPVELEGVGIEEHLGENISPSLVFSDESGKAVALGDYFDGKRPVFLMLVYYECPNLCNFLLNGFTEAVTELGWSAGKEFQIVTVSIDPAETSPLAQAKKESYLKKYGRPEAEEGWHFLTGSPEAIGQLAKEAGFQYRYDEDQKQYAHSAAVFVLTPSGQISRTLYGITFRPKDLKLSLLEASEGKIGNVMDRLLLFCYHYDPQGRKYGLFAVRLMQIAGGVTVIAVGALLIAGKKRKPSC